MKTRIAKFIADSGIASRRAAERLIESGAVAVDDVVVTSPVFFVDGTEKITVGGKPIQKQTSTELYAFHKPINTMTTACDPLGRKTIYDVIPKKYQHLKYVGRLDFKTTGLLLMTNDGELARQLTLPASNIERTYIATVTGDDFSNINRAHSGITVDGITYRPMQIEQIADHQLRVTVTEGKKNEVRIVLAAIGLPVRKLHRVRFGNVKLGNLSVGQIARVDQKSIDALQKSL